MNVISGFSKRCKGTFNALWVTIFAAIKLGVIVNSLKLVNFAVPRRFLLTFHSDMSLLRYSVRDENRKRLCWRINDDLIAVLMRQEPSKKDFFLKVALRDRPGILFHGHTACAFAASPFQQLTSWFATYYASVICVSTGAVIFTSTQASNIATRNQRRFVSKTFNM